MIIPKEFVALCSSFHQDIDLMGSTEREWIAYALGNLNAQQKGVVKRFIGELLAKDCGEKEFLRVWNSSGAEVGFGNAGDQRIFLTKIRDMIEEDR
jgi:hypothetical protein